MYADIIMTPPTSIYLVTGAAQGIGKAIAQLLLEQGHTVALIDKCGTALEQTFTNWPAHYQTKASLWSVDITDNQAVNETIDRIETQLGPIYYLAHAAGILRLSPLSEMSSRDFESLMSVHVSASFNLLQKISQVMGPRRQGSIVVVGSNGASTPRNNMGAYCASKAALHMLTKCFALELSELGIRCNIVSPGSTRTDMQTQMWSEHYQEAQTIAGDQTQFRLGIPLKKIAEPADIAQAVLFLLSDHAGHITMHDLRVDGGATLDQR